MSKALLEFNLDDIDDQLAFNRATKSLNLSLALWKISQLKDKLEFHIEVNIDENDPDAKWDARDYILEEIRAIFEEYNINIDELIR
jgi:hypothetical protein